LNTARRSARIFRFNMPECAQNAVTLQPESFCNPNYPTMQQIEKKRGLYSRY